MATKEHWYKGEQIVRSVYAESKRWQIVSYHITGMRYAETPGSGYRTLADARAAIDADIEAHYAERAAAGLGTDRGVGLGGHRDA
ncbi:MAG: hypothetical protein NUW01_19330 [Gemmatimonadaceae bacterium]|nr:hypothetical protein [Gemmatimonadaceae bacterium]